MAVGCWYSGIICVGCHYCATAVCPDLGYGCSMVVVVIAAVVEALQNCLADCDGHCKEKDHIIKCDW